MLASNREALKRLGIKLSPEARACLARPTDAPAFRTALSNVDLRRCRSAEAVVELLDQALVGAMVGQGDTLLQRVFLTPSETLAGHYELHLGLRPMRGEKKLCWE
jgi:hypothetical protein